MQHELEQVRKELKAEEELRQAEEVKQRELHAGLDEQLANLNNQIKN